MVAQSARQLAAVLTAGGGTAPATTGRGGQTSAAGAGLAAGAGAAMTGLMARQMMGSMKQQLAQAANDALGVPRQPGQVHGGSGAARRGTTRLEVEVPPGVSGGQQLQVPHPQTGAVTIVTIPAGLRAGQTFQVDV
jgi:hypothetical protein